MKNTRTPADNKPRSAGKNHRLRRRREPPRASRRSAFEIFLTALQEIDRLSKDCSYDDLPTFTQDWLKGKISDYGNARSLMRTWGLLTKSGNLNPEFVTRVQHAQEKQAYEELREFLREQFRAGYEDLLADRVRDYDPATLDRLGELDFDSKVLRQLPGIADEDEPQAKDKREQCFVAVSDLIRYCHDRAILAKEAAQKAPRTEPREVASPQTGPASHEPNPAAGIPASVLEDALAGAINYRAFNMRDQSHENFKAEVYFNVPPTPYWVEQLGLRLLDWADQLREQKANY